MRTRTRTRAQVVASGACAMLVLGTALAPTAAQAATSDEVEVVNTETVQSYADATGEVDTSRLYEQLSLTGDGETTVRNPALTEGMRNLEGFGGFDVEDGEQVVTLDVDGSEDLRTVSDYEGDLPLDIEAHYVLDGKEVDPEDLVGASGDLAVTYTVRNVTGETREVTFDDGNGGTITEDVEVSLPMVGSLTTVLPASYHEVQSGQANMAGDGRGATKLSFTMTLVPPIGADTVSFGYEAHIEDAVLPRATVTALPVDPLASPTFASAGKSYQSGADTGAELASGAAEIDSHLLELRDGAATLLAGLIKLRDGADQLTAGLEGKAVPGSAKLADGAGRLEDGMGQIDDGANKLADGSGRLAGGTSEALAGSQKLSAGLGQISDGLDQLAAADGLPAAESGIKQLSAGVDALSAGLGSPNDPTTLLGGLALLQGGVDKMHAGSGQLVGGLQQLADGLPVAKGGVDQVKGGLDAATSAGGSLDRLAAGLSSLLTRPGCDQDPVCKGTVAALLDGVSTSKSDLGTASAGLGQVSDGLAGAITGVNQMLPGAKELNLGLAQASQGVTDLTLGATKLKGGTDQVGAGLDQLAGGVGTAVSGVLQLSAGADAAHSGSGELGAGLGRIDQGAGELADGAGRLAAGTGTAAAGSSELAAGAQELADGLAEAGDGSARLADGLDKAADGAPKLVDGAGRLSDEGTKKLVEAGEDTAAKYGLMYATLVAGADRAQDESMVVGAPDGAIGLAAYTVELQGEDGESSRNLVRGLIGLGLFAAAGATVLLRRRMA